MSARLCQRVIFARVSEAGFHPLGLDQPGAFEASQQRIDGAFRDNQAGAVFEAPKHLKTVKAARPKSGQRRQFDAALTQLHFPFIG